jgi:hypothetical protein
MLRERGASREEGGGTGDEAPLADLGHVEAAQRLQGDHELGLDGDGGGSADEQPAEARGQAAPMAERALITPLKSSRVPTLA